MKKILYLDCASGISGDMFVAALLDLKLFDAQEVLDELRKLPIDGFELEYTPTKSHGLAAMNFEVKLTNSESHFQEQSCDHNSKALSNEHHHHHEHELHHDHDSHHEHDHEHEHEHEHEHHHPHDHHHEHVHRSLPDILTILEQSQLTSGARQLAKQIFEIVAEAESKAHGVPIEQVHFHEVGAIDSIVDIAAASILMDRIAPDGVVIRELSEGTGWVQCQHGELPVPVPAVVNIATTYGLPIRSTSTKGEMITPTGAAIAATIRTSPELPEHYTISAVGLGAGKRNFDHPNILRAMLLETESELPSPTQDSIWILETNLDDCPGEMLGLALEQLLNAGARDVHFIPCFMKKNRPGQILRVICDEALISTMENIIFECTTTIGIRRSKWQRTRMAREKITVDTEFGPVEIKQCHHGKITRNYPEFESVRRVAEATQAPFWKVFRASQQASDEK